MFLNLSRLAPGDRSMTADNPSTRRPLRWAGVTILCLAAILRLAALDSIPPGLQHDEVFKTIFVEQVRSGQFPIFFDLNGGNEPFLAYLVTGTLALFGGNVLALRLPVAAGGLIGIAALWSLTRRLWGERVAALAALLMATSVWNLMDSRVSLRAIWLPTLMTVGYFLLWRAVNRSRWPWYVAGGLVLGLSLYTYTSSVLGVVTVLVFGLWMLARGRRRAGAGLLAAAMLALALGVPLAVHWLDVPEAGLRMRDLSYEVAALREGNPLPVLRSSLRVAGMFAFVGDPEWRYNVAGRPVFLLPVGLAVYYGLWLCRRRRHDPHYVFLALWAAVNLAASAVTGSSPSTLRAVGAMPAAFILAAVGCLEVYDRLARRGGRRLAAAVLVPVLALEVGLGLYNYFVVWPGAAEVRDIYRADLADIARSIGRSANERPALVSTEFASDLDRLSFEYLGFTDIRPRYFDGSTGLLLPAEPSTLYVPASRPLSPALQTVLGGRGELREEGGSFQAWSISPDSMDGADRLAAVEAPWPGPALEILGVDLPDTAQGGSTLDVVVRYRVAAPAPGGHAVTFYAHLRDQAGFLWTQTDSLTYPTSDWRLGDEVYQVLRLDLPPDMPDVIATVEIGVYEDAAQPYTLRIGAEGLPFTRLSVGSAVIQGTGAPVDDLAAELGPGGDGHLVGASVGPRVVQPGQDIEVVLWWEAAVLDEIGPVSAALTDNGVSQSLETAAASGAGTVGEGVALRQRLRFTVPPETARGEWILLLQVAESGGEVELGTVFVGSVEHVYSAPAPAVPCSVLFGDRARLLGLAEGIGTVERGQTIEPELLWEAVGLFDRDLTVFVHLMDAEGRVWAGQDSMPAQGTRRTRGWLVGETIRDLHRLAVPTDTPAGTYRLVAGLYDADRVGYPRLPVTGAETEAGEDWALIAEIEVVE